MESIKTSVINHANACCNVLYWYATITNQKHPEHDRPQSQLSKLSNHVLWLKVLRRAFRIKFCQHKIGFKAIWSQLKDYFIHYQQFVNIFKMRHFMTVLYLLFLILNHSHLHQRRIRNLVVYVS